MERGWERSLWLVVPRVVGGTTHLKISSDCAASESESVSGALWVAMNSPRIVYRAKDRVTPENELDALAAVYRFILDCRTEKKASHPGGPDDRERRSDEIPAKASIP